MLSSKEYPQTQKHILPVFNDFLQMFNQLSDIFETKWKNSENESKLKN